MRLSVDAQNITGEQHYEYYDVPSRLNDVDVEGRIYSFSVGYVF